MLPLVICILPSPWRRFGSICMPAFTMDTYGQAAQCDERDGDGNIGTGRHSMVQMSGRWQRVLEHEAPERARKERKDASRRSAVSRSAR